jgi:hypothetical protein
MSTRYRVRSTHCCATHLQANRMRGDPSRIWSIVWSTPSLNQIQYSSQRPDLWYVPMFMSPKHRAAKLTLNYTKCAACHTSLQQLHNIIFSTPNSHPSRSHTVLRFQIHSKSLIRKLLCIGNNAINFPLDTPPPPGPKIPE